jgi:predicted nucleotidyltransferase
LARTELPIGSPRRSRSGILRRVTIDDRSIELVERHPAVRRVRLVGSRARGTATDFSDWDFAVVTDDFQAVARDIPLLLNPLVPIAQQWDRLSETWCWMVVLRGPIKLDFIFSEPHKSEPPWQPSAGNLDAIDCHFWDWALWLRSKQASGKSHLLEHELEKLADHILSPMGVESRPASLNEAVVSYLVARDRLERRFGVSVPSALEREIGPVFDAPQDTP